MFLELKELSNVLASSNTAVESNAKLVTALDKLPSRYLVCASSTLPLLSEETSQTVHFFHQNPVP